ncbi:MAG: response regulator [Chloroflexota bacterium]|nr:response regulator [Chloroflexota bacterium]
MSLATDRPILVVDDDDDIRDLLREALTDEGYTVHSAPNGRAALRVLDDQLPALILLDLNMPELDGWGFVRELAKRRITIPVLLVTAERNGKDHAKTLEAAGFIGKPFDVTDVLTTIKQLLADAIEPHATIDAPA